MIARRLIAVAFLLGLAACAPANPEATPSTAPNPISLPPAWTPLYVTTTPTILPAPDPDLCSAEHWEENFIYALSPRQFGALSPGGPSTFDQILADQNPAWADFEQLHQGELRSAGKIFHEASLGPDMGQGVNPAVVLVTYGLEYDWELPQDGDIVSKVEYLRDVLYQHEIEWFMGIVGPSEYPGIYNGATYALFRVFDDDAGKLETWCRTYLSVYGELPNEDPLPPTPTLSPGEKATQAFTETQSYKEYDRSCTDADFPAAGEQPDMDDPDTLIGYRPPRNWTPGPEWEFEYGSLISNTGFHVAGFQHNNDYLVLFKKSVCRYGDNKYRLAEIVDYVWLSEVGNDEIIITNQDYGCCFMPDSLWDRRKFQIEMFTFADCGELWELTDDPVIRTRFDTQSIPAQIEPGYLLPVDFVDGWFPNPDTGLFEELDSEEISCEIRFVGK